MELSTHGDADLLFRILHTCVREIIFCTSSPGSYLVCIHLMFYRMADFVVVCLSVVLMLMLRVWGKL